MFDRCHRIDRYAMMCSTVVHLFWKINRTRPWTRAIFISSELLIPHMNLLFIGNDSIWTNRTPWHSIQRFLMSNGSFENMFFNFNRKKKNKPQFELFPCSTEAADYYIEMSIFWNAAFNSHMWSLNNINWSTLARIRTCDEMLYLCVETWCSTHTLVSSISMQRFGVWTIKIQRKKWLGIYLKIEPCDEIHLSLN